MAIKARQSLEGETIVFIRKTDKIGKETRQASETQNLIQQEMMHPVCTRSVHSASTRTWPSLYIRDQTSEPCYCRAVVTAANSSFAGPGMCWRLLRELSKLAIPANTQVLNKTTGEMTNIGMPPYL